METKNWVCFYGSTPLLQYIHVIHIIMTSCEIQIKWFQKIKYFFKHKSCPTKFLFFHVAHLCKKKMRKKLACTFPVMCLSLWWYLVIIWEPKQSCISTVWYHHIHIWTIFFLSCNTQQTCGIFCEEFKTVAETGIFLPAQSTIYNRSEGLKENWSYGNFFVTGFQWSKRRYQWLVRVAIHNQI